jgi:N-methylhydantoinase A
MTAIAEQSTSDSTRRPSGYVIGVDIGGTFTDCVVYAPDGTMTGAKAPTTPENRAQGFFDSIEVAADKLGLPLRSLLERSERVVHGTTAGTNAIVARDGAVTGLITTAGHGDIMFLMGGGGRTSGLAADQALHVPSTDKPEPLVPKRLVATVPERIDVDGEVIVPLDEDAAREAIRHLVEDEGAESLAISLMWSVTNPRHEQRIRELAAEVAPGLFVCCGSDLVNQVGEYERTTTTVMNAYIGPIMVRYIDSIEAGAAERGFPHRVLFAQCAGGAITGEEAKAAPIRTVQSGPVAGIVSSQMLARQIDTENVLLADMGGTTFDVSVIRHGTGLRRDVSTFQRYELALPMLDVESVGAGGGSIAWVDSSGRLNVGPRSAGAVPGPACYGNGGTEATVTDADVVLGVIDPARFLNGRMEIRPELAEQAIGRLAERLGLGLLETAAGINRIVDAKMADLVRRMSVLRGLDPRRFHLYAFGGGGPVHSPEVARQAGIAHVVVPLPAIAAMWSALGAAVADVTHVYQQPHSVALPVRAEEIEDIFGELESRAAGIVRQQGLDTLPTSIARSLRIKYSMQVHDVDVPMPGAISPDDAADIADRFDAIYAELFGPDAGYREGGAEITSLHVQYHGVTAKPALRPLGPATEDGVRRSSRPVFWAETGSSVDTPVVRLTGTGVPAGELAGPVLVELPDTVVAIRPGMTGSFDGYGNLHVDTGLRGKA